MVQGYLCERRASKYRVSSDLGVDMIHKLGIHGPNEGNVLCEDLARSPIGAQIETIAEAIRTHVSAVANGKQFTRCVLAFRVWPCLLL